VKSDNTCPIGLVRSPRSRMTGSDRRLDDVRTAGDAEFFSALESRKATADQNVIPHRPVLVEEQNRLSRRAYPCPRARCLDLHQRHEAVNFGLLWSEFRQDAAETQCIFT